MVCKSSRLKLTSVEVSVRRRAPRLSLLELLVGILRQQVTHKFCKIHPSWCKPSLSSNNLPPKQSSPADSTGHCTVGGNFRKV